MREYITFSIDCDSGEADLTPASRRKVEELVREGLWSADVFGDIHGIAEELYERAMQSWRTEMAEVAVAKFGEDVARENGFID